MAFLLPNILWGLLAISLPVIIHFISLRKTKMVEYSSIQHIKALQNNSIKKLKIMQWFLIILRMGIIASLVLMASGPILVNNATWVPSEKESVAVIVIDNSASMAVRKDRESFLDEALYQVPEILKSFSGLVNLKVYQTTPPKELFSGMIEPGDQVDYKSWTIQQSVGKDNIWNLINDVLVSVEQPLPNRECFILSDFPIPPPVRFKTDFPDWRFYCFGREPLIDNVAVSEIEAISQIKLPNHLLKLNTKIENMGSVEKRNIPVELYLNDERVGQIVSHFRPSKSKEFLFQVYPGKSGVVRGKLELPRDHFSLDNKQTFELNIPEQISCKVIAGSQSELFMFKTVLESINGNNQFLDIELKATPDIERIYLEETDVLILQDPRTFSPSAIEAIKRFLNQGGSILWFSGQNYSSLAPITISSLQLPIAQEQIILNDDAFFSVNVKDREHPLLQELNLRNLETSLPQVFGYNHMVKNKSSKEILSLNNGAPFLLEIPFGSSPIYLFSSPLNLKWNDFSMKGLLIPFIHRLLVLSATDEVNTRLVEVNRVKTIKIPKEMINKKWAVKTPSGNKILVVPDYNNESIVFGQTNELGSYEVYAGSDLFTAFSTHLSPYESPKLRSSPEKIIQSMGSDQLVWITPEMPSKETIESQRHGRALWRTFLIIAISLLMIESYLSRPKKNAFKTI